LAEEKPSIAEVLDANRRFIYALLATPYLGMLIAIGLIWYKKPSNMYLATGIIFFLMVQYGLTVYFFVRRLDNVVETDKAKDLRASEGARGEEECR